ncbi:MAG: NADH-quinone oxidoreductase subunit N [Chitinophagales bacterium]|jgi:NADH-quinone oxidoreductase subunit N|nr:NADH-quinone oxidoreductase subunit N [Sphingobacteriales bacterium]
MLVILILFITGLCTMFASLHPNKALPKYLGILGILIALVTLHLRLGLGLDFPAFFTMFPLTRIMTVIALFLILILFILQRKYEKDYDWSAVYSLMLFSTCGVILLLGQQNLLILFLGIEIMSIPLYVLAASKKTQAASLEAGLKYFILGAFASAFLLFGIALVYGTTGSFVMNEIIHIQNINGVQLPAYFHIGYIFIIIAILFKMAVAPFHFWSPDVYDGSPTVVTTFMTTLVKLGSSVTMYYILVGYFRHQFDNYFKFLLPIICVSFLLGAILGLAQNNVKRMLAYSSISHIGFVLTGIILGIALQDMSLFVFYLLTYTLSSLIVFSILDYIENGNAVFLDHLNGLSKHQPLLAVAFAIGILSMAGIPFTGGFIAKYRVLTGIYQINGWMFAIGLLSSAVAAGYYLKTLNRIFFYENNQENFAIKNIYLVVIMVILSIMILILGTLPELLLQGIHKYFLA